MIFKGGTHAPQGVDPIAKAAFDKGNEYRAKEGKPALQWDDTIYDECNRQAQAQVSGGLNHLLVPWGTSRAENIAYGQTTGEEVATTWFNSPGHYKNLMGAHTHSAVGKAVGPGSTVQWCQRFR